MAQHTPGPWRVFTTPDNSKVIGIGERTGDGIADCGFGVWRGGSEEARANAQLMAAAPDMLAALKGVQPNAEEAIADASADLQEGSDNAGLRWIIARWQAVLDAIAKAEGRQ
jgi:hypothetical protein